MKYSVVIVYSYRYIHLQNTFLIINVQRQILHWKIFISCNILYHFLYRNLLYLIEKYLHNVNRYYIIHKNFVWILHILHRQNNFFYKSCMPFHVKIFPSTRILITTKRNIFDWKIIYTMEMYRMGHFNVCIWIPSP